MHTKSWLMASAALAVLAGQTPAAAEDEIGVVVQKQYQGAQGIREGAAAEPLHYRNDVHARETVTTGPSGRTGLEFLDRTRLQVGGNASILLDSFAYDPEQRRGAAALTFGRGVFRFVSGRMQNKDGYVLKTPTATLAVRGTSFLVWVALTGRTDVWVEEGVVAATGCGGHSAEAAADAGFSVAADCSGIAARSERSVPRDPGVDGGEAAGGRRGPDAGDQGGDDGDDGGEGGDGGDGG